MLLQVPRYCAIVAQMKRATQPDLYPSLVVGSVSGWEAWKAAIAAPQTKDACDVMELRADTLPVDISVADILAQPRIKPILLTVRHADEGGARPMNEEQRMWWAEQLLPIANALDWEIAHWDTAQPLLEKARDQGLPLVASAHDFEKTPSLTDLCTLADKAISQGADIVKFAFRLHSMQDMQVGTKLLERYQHPVAIMGMGPLGATSRLIYSQYGSVLTYGYLGNTPTAPGQWSAQLCKLALAQLLPIKH